MGYNVRAAIADTIGTAWAVARYGKGSAITGCGKQMEALITLPAAALRLEGGSTERLEKLGLRQVGHFIGMPRSALRRRFGEQFIQKLDQALGYEEEVVHPVQPVGALPGTFTLPGTDCNCNRY